MILLEQFETHPAADLFPMIPEADLERLAVDIKQNGLLRPITMYQGKVLDGRNRLLACNRSGTEYRFEQFEDLGHLSPTAWVLSQNLYRRHLNLSESQRALIAASAKELLEAEAAERKENPSPDERAMPAREQAAKAAGISMRTVENAEEIRKRAVPELIDAIQQGKTSMRAASYLVDEPEDRQKELVAAGTKAIQEAVREKKKSLLGENERERLLALAQGREPEPDYDPKRVRQFIKRAIDISKLPDAHNAHSLLIHAVQCLLAEGKEEDLNKEYENKWVQVDKPELCAL